MIGTRLLDRYELTEEIGRGGMGVVYRARDPLLVRDVAIKMIPPSRLRPETEGRFRREAQLVAQMDHPAIVPIHDFGEHEGAFFFVMPLVEGTTLRQLIDEKSLDLGAVLDIAVQVAEALAYSHGRGILHRDVKPENVMITRDRGNLRARVMDFGLARETAESRLTESGGLVGTVAYLSPEQIAAGHSDERSDLYALGAVLYECFVGAPPFAGTVHMQIYRIASETPAPFGDHGLELDSELEDLVLRCLAKDPTERPQSAEDLAAGLQSLRERLASGTAATAGRPPGGSSRLPLVGRRIEWAVLQKRLQASLKGECQLALIGGETGIGKSRLVGELVSLARARGIRVLRGRFADRESALPFQGFCELIQDYFRARETGSFSSSTGLPVEPDLVDLAPDLLALFPSLSEVASLRDAAAGGHGDGAGGGAGGESGEAGRESEAGDHRAAGEVSSGDLSAIRPTDLYELLARTLTRLAAGRPAVLVIENLHVGDEAIEALDYIVHRLGPTPTLLVGTYLSTEIDRGHPLARLLARFHDDPRFASIVMSALGFDEHRRWIELLLGSSELDDRLVRELWEATEGNPLFAKELVRSLRESEGILRSEGRWVLAGRGGTARGALPATIQQVVERRVARLPDDHRRVLEVASVLGRGFEYDDLAGLVALGDLEDVVDSLVEKELLNEEASSRGDRLGFPSGVVRDVFYQALPRRRRRSLHRRHAENLEKAYASRLERVLPQLVAHFAEGDEAEKTVRYAVALARRSLETFSPEEAIFAVRTALEFVEEDEIAEGTAVQGELLVIAARAHRALGHLNRAFDHAQRAAEILERDGRTAAAARAALLGAEICWQSRRGDRTRHWVEHGLDLARRAGDGDERDRPGPSPGTAGDDRRATRRKLLMLGATVANLRGEYAEARAHLEEAERIAPGDPSVADERWPEGGNLVIALPASVVELEPGRLQSDEEVEVSACVFETLLQSDADGHLGSLLCEEWEGDAEGRRFVFTLRREARFADGAPVTAAAVKESLERSARVAPEPLSALAAVRGLGELLDGRAAGIDGLVVLDRRRIAVELSEPLPLLPALLTHPDTAIVRVGETAGAESPGGEERAIPELIGTGPFRLERLRPEPILLRRNRAAWRGAPPYLDTLEIRTSLDATGVAEGLRSGEIDVGRDLLPEDLEQMLRQPRFRSGLVEATKKNVYFVLFNVHGPLARHAELRRALIGIVRTHDLVWRTLGRLAQPAVGLIPPGILGHDPGRRLDSRSAAWARDLLDRAGLCAPLRLSAAVHPLLLSRHSALTSALFDDWATLGVEVDVVTDSMETFLEAGSRSAGIDVRLGRWIADYDDPDTFTHGLFHSREGLFRSYFSAAEADRLLERARRERSSAARQELYQRFEDLLRDTAAVLPLFHDIDYRIAGPRVRGLRLDNTPPYVSYARIAKVEETAPPARRRRPRGGEIHIPIPSPVDTLDPTVGNITNFHEVIPNVFETLTRVEEGARIVPWLAESLAEEGASYRFRLRPGLRFHDGRRLTARDVRYSFERLLRTSDHVLHFLLLPVRGARGLRDGDAVHLEGFRILSAGEFVLELERPLALFPALLTHPTVAVVPEGSEVFTRRWRDGTAGTGPFRVVHFAPSQALDLEKNPFYWRAGFPRSEHLSFHFGMTPGQILADFRAGRLSVASDLDPKDVEALRRDAAFAPGYSESPRLATYFLVLNARRGPFADPERRRALVQALDLDRLVHDSGGSLVIRAHGIVPPGLLGYEVPRRPRRPTEADLGLLRGRAVAVAVHPEYAGQYAGLWKQLAGALQACGLRCEEHHGTVSENLAQLQSTEMDLVAFRYLADYPDADSFFTGLLDAKEGILSSICGEAELTRLIERGRLESDPAVRHAVYRDIEEILVDRTYVISLFHEQIYRFVHPTVRGMRFGLTVPEVRYEELYTVG